MTHGLKHAPNLAVSPLGDGYPIPAIGAFAATLFNRAKLGNTIAKLNTRKQALFFFSAQPTQDPNRVLAFKTKSGMHQIIGKFARTREQEKPFSVQVKPSN
jgi:hypothetical protein